MSYLTDLNHTPANYPFPPVISALADPDGLLAVGGCLTVPRLVNAYQHGIFPWFGSNDPILWWCPSERAVIHAKDLHISRSLAKFMRSMPYRTTLNMAFAEVIHECATIPRGGPGNGTWITAPMIAAYNELHHAGHAHSVEVWCGEELVGGVYGVIIGSVFCGESMFSKATNASKVALVALRNYLQPLGLSLIDCQIPNPHLTAMGATTVPRTKFINLLQPKETRPEPMENKGSITIFSKQSLQPRELS